MHRTCSCRAARAKAYRAQCSGLRCSAEGGTLMRWLDPRQVQSRVFWGTLHREHPGSTAFVLMSLLFDVSITTTTFFSFPFAWIIFFHPYTVSFENWLNRASITRDIGTPSRRVGVAKARYEQKKKLSTPVATIHNWKGSQTLGISP